jgi:mono/diheme cytochrome c family protein
MRNIVVLAAVVVGMSAAFACSSSTNDAVGDDDAGDPSAEGGGAVLPPSGTSPQGPAGTGLETGLPCDVQAILEDRCIACHSGTSPPPLLSYANLLAPSPTDPQKTLAQLSLDRMKSITNPMPPKPAEAPAADEIQVFEDWVKAGSPKGATCTDTPPDGGAPDGGDGGGVSKCTSGKTWANGNQGSALMHPGTACNACHQQQGGPNLRIAGTLYPTLHEPNDCNGSAPPPALTVVITDKNGRVTRIPVNAAGNFSTRTRVTPPYKAAVTDGTKTRAMVGSVTAGDCNSCHTDPGANGAPGRVMAP